MTQLDAAFWRAVRANDFALPEEPDLAELTESLLALLAATDPELRDTIGYETLATWMSRGVYAAEELRAIGRGLLPRLTAGIETPGTDAVFERAFTMLELAELIHNDNKTPFLEEVELRAWLTAGLEAFARERDLRGYLPGTGWAHATAHAADLCAVAARSQHLGRAALEQILSAIADKLTAPTPHVFVHLEDERLSAAVLAVLRRELLDPAYLTDWLARLSSNDYQFDTAWFADAPATNARHNAQCLLRSLYLQLHWGSDLPSDAADVAQLVAGAICKLASDFYAPLPSAAPNA